MEFPQIEEYEYKSPSYELHNRKLSDNWDVYKKQSRYFYDDEKGIYCSKVENKDSISMIFAGDLLCQENMVESYRTSDGGYDFSLCFEYVRPIFKSADFVAGNLETPISHTAPYRGEILSHEGPFYCNAPVQYLEALSYAGFDMLTTANNHTLDAGVRGLLETIENTRKFGFIQTGTFLEKNEKFVIVDVCGFKIGFTAFSVSYNSMQNNMNKKGRIALLNTYTDNRAQTVYDEMRAKGAEFVVAFPHWGKEYTDEISEKQQNMADMLTKIGYDFVVGSHAHVIQKFEIINEKPVLFSLGNLISHLNCVGKKSDEEFTLLYHLTLTRQQQNIVSEIEFIPCRILKNYNRIPFTVVPIDENLHFSEDLNKKLKKVPQKVLEFLKNDNASLNLKFPVLEEQLTEFCNAEDKISDKLSCLFVDAEEMNIESDSRIQDGEFLKPKRHFWDKFEDYVIRAEGNYKIYSNYAELVRVTSNATVFRMEEEIQGKPIKVISNNCEGNEVIRIIYLSKYTEILGKATFKNFTQLESVRFFNYLKVIEANAFENCIRMTGLILPKSLKSIRSNAFRGCSSLLSVKIPPNVTSIAENAFSGCEKLTIYCEKGSMADKYARKCNISVKYMPLS